MATPERAPWGLLKSLNAKRLDVDLKIKVFNIGRHASCQVKIFDTRISNVHCRISEVDQADQAANAGAPARITDLSTNGTFLNGVKIGRGESRELRTGDSVALVIVPYQREDGAWCYDRDASVKDVFVAYEFHTVAAPPTQATQRARKAGAAAASTQSAGSNQSQSQSQSQNEAGVDEVSTTERLRKLLKPQSEGGQEALNADFDVAANVLGSGGFGKVFSATHRTTGIAVAVKEVNFAKMKLSYGTSLREDQYEDEYLIHAKLQHPNILQLLTYYKSDKKLWIVLEKADGGDLFDHLIGLYEESQGGVQEPVARRWFGELLDAVSYMHSKGVLHRDLKPENVLLMKAPGASADDFNYSIKVTDFGVSRSLNTHANNAKTVVGTYHYMAPEVAACKELQTAYGPPSDMWGLGVVLHVMLACYTPFGCGDEKTEIEIMREMGVNKQMPKTHKGLFAAEVGETCLWDHISDSAKSLVRELLHPDPKKRITAAQAKAHPWVTGLDIPPAQGPEVKEEGPKVKEEGGSREAKTRKRARSK